jgi:hypothetical protein
MSDDDNNNNKRTRDGEEEDAKVNIMEELQTLARDANVMMAKLAVHLQLAEASETMQEAEMAYKNLLSARECVREVHEMTGVYCKKYRQ